jgi:hypothetical protein
MAQIITFWKNVACIARILQQIRCRNEVIYGTPGRARACDVRGVDRASTDGYILAKIRGRNPHAGLTFHLPDVRRINEQVEKKR